MIHYSLQFTVYSFILTSGNGPAGGNNFREGIVIFVLRDHGSRGDIFLALAVVGPSRLVDGLNPEEDHPAAEVLTCVVKSKLTK